MDETGTADEGGEFDSKAAARLLKTTTRRAQDQFEFRTPLLTLIQAAALLAAYGAIWLSVRGQNPYSGPTGAALVELYAFIAVAAVAVGLEARRAGAGVSRRSSGVEWTRAVPFVAAFLSAFFLVGHYFTHFRVATGVVLLCAIFLYHSWYKGLSGLSAD